VKTVKYGFYRLKGRLQNGQSLSEQPVTHRKAASRNLFIAKNGVHKQKNKRFKKEQKIVHFETLLLIFFGKLRTFCKKKFIFKVFLIIESTCSV